MVKEGHDIYFKIGIGIFVIYTVAYIIRFIILG